MTRRQRQAHFEEHDDNVILYPRKKKNSEPSLKISNIRPKTHNQEKVFRSWQEGQNLLLTGCPGTGKSFLALYLALSEVHKGEQKKVYLYRSAVPSRDVGFMPGNLKEKTKVFEAPYYSICADLYGRGDAYDVLKGKNIIEFTTTSFIRGLTLDNCIVIFDELQNETAAGISSVITRVGENSRVIFSGDFFQTDLNGKEKSGVREFERIAARMESFDCIEFGINDVLRSGLVREYLQARHDLGI